MTKDSARQLTVSKVEPDEFAEERGDPAPSPPFPIAGIGASAGGLEAFTQLLEQLPDDTGMAFVLVQHLDPKHENKLGSLLAKATAMPIQEATQNLTVYPNHVYIIPKNTTLTISRGVLQLQPRGEVRGPHLPVDLFLKSLAEDQQSAAIGVVLSGTGSDGTLGLAEIKAVGGITFAQDKDSAKHDGMPQSAVGHGSVDFVLTPGEIARELTRIGRHPYIVAHPQTGGRGPDDAGEEPFRKILTLLRSAFGVDFTHYRDTTIRRRTLRRMVLHSKESLADYARLLEEDRFELEALFQDILINVTSFFRDSSMFEVLKARVFPEILKTKSAGTPIRGWTAGCSTGQEAYSLAIALLEFLDDKPQRPPIQVFATDLSDTLSLEKARAGLYPESIEGEVSPERLRRYFAREDGKYRISKSIRDMCIFAKQNILADPPFSRVDLISCRNVLIYLASPLQKRVIPTFHYALNPTGYLMLGASETVGEFADLFTVVDKSHKIYAKKPTAFRQYPHFNTDDYLAGVSGVSKNASQPSLNPADLQREADRIVLGRYAPAGVLVSHSLEILQFRGRTSPYLEPAPGAASLNLLKMARDGLYVDLKSALDEAKKGSVTVERHGLRVRDDSQVREVNLDIVPVTLPGMNECCFLVLFEEASPATEPRAAAAGPRPGGATRVSSFVKRLFMPRRAAERATETEGLASPADQRELLELRRELVASREQQQLISEQHEAVNEELKSANEEILSSNEELQSTNEELETAKEELQSVNEELTTVNEQLQNRNVEANRLNDDLLNLLGSGNVPMVSLGIDLRIRRFTPAAGKVLNLLPADVGRPIGDIKPPVEVPDLEQLLLDVIATVQVKEREVRDREGRWYALRIHPYRTADNKIDGAVVVVSDIDEVKNAQLRLEEAGAYTQAIVETVRESLLILTADLRVISANHAFYETFQVTPRETENQFLHDLGGMQWDIPPLRKLLGDVDRNGLVFESFEVEHEFPGVGHRVMLLNARRLVCQGDATHQILLALEDITDRKAAEADVRASELRYRRLFESAQDGILILDPDTRKITDVNPFMTELLGYPSTEFLGKELWEIGLLENEEACQAAFRELKATGYLRSEDLSLQTRSGQKRDLEFISNLYREAGHDVIQCNIREITARKRWEQALRASGERFPFLAESMPQKIFTTKPSGDVDYFNGQWSEFTGLSFEQIQGWNWTQFLHPGDLEETVRCWRHSIDTGEPYQLEHRFRRADGAYHWHLSRAHAMRDSGGCVLMWIGSSTDIDDQKRTEEALKDADRRKNEFLAMLAHELRNPLAAIGNAVKLFHRGEFDAADATWSQEVIDRQVKILARLVDDLLDISRITQGKVHLQREPVELGPLVGRAVEAVRHYTEVRNHTLSISLPQEPVRLDADPTRLEQVLINLLGNAAKYSEPGGHIGIQVQDQDQGGEVVITVSDTGVGISPEMQPRVFDLFTQVERSLDRSQGGLGIGLTLVRSLVELHGGSITVSSIPGQGSVFTVRLPVGETPPRERPEPTASPALQVLTYRILVVDDNVDTAHGMARLLKRAGHDVQTAYDGPSAIDAARTHRPEITLLDIGLPGMTGYEVAVRIRQEEELKGSVIIAISGYGQDVDRSRSQEAGLDHHLVKPVDFDVLLTLLDETCKGPAQRGVEESGPGTSRE